MSLFLVNNGVGNFREYATKRFDVTISTGLGYEKVDVVFVVHIVRSIKSAEHLRRGEQKMCYIKIRHGEVCSITKN